MSALPVALALHLLAATLWVGGMVVMLAVVRPTAVALLEPPLRGRFLAETLARFFRWVWGAVVVLLASGYWMLFAVFGGMAAVGLHIHLMQGLGLLMVLIFCFIYFVPFRRLKANLAQGQGAAAGHCLGRIRLLVTVNAALGLAVVAIASGGRYL